MYPHLRTSGQEHDFSKTSLARSDHKILVIRQEIDERKKVKSIKKNCSCYEDFLRSRVFN